MRLLFPLCLAIAACSSDPAPPIDSGPADTGAVQADIGSYPDAVDVPAVPHDQGTDSGAVDAGDVVAVRDAVAADVVDAGVVDAGATGDVGSDVPTDVRINCAVPGAPDIACRSHADCARCVPGAFNSIWCCARNGTCGNTSSPTCN